MTWNWTTRSTKYDDLFAAFLPVAIAWVLLFVSSSFVKAENWPGWRGSQRSGVAGGDEAPLRWSKDEGILWKTPLVGSGISSPIVWQDRVFLTSADGPRQSELHIICLSNHDGKELWHHRFWGTAPTRYHNTKSSMASATPITDGEYVFAFFGTGDLFCVDNQGLLQWHRSLATEHGAFENRFSATSSPLLYRDLLLLQCDHYGDSYLLAIDKKTGKDRWKVERPETWLSWSSPQLVDDVGDDKHSEMIVCGSQKIDAFDPLTGRFLWTVGGMRRECIPTPVLGHGFIYAVSGPKGPTLAIKPGGRGDVSETHVVWRNQRGAPFVPSAILVGDYYYLIDDSGIGTCLNAHTGKRVWQKRFPGNYTSSPVAASGKIYFTNEAGDTHIIQASTDKLKRVAVNSLGEPVFSSPAISSGRLYLRSSKRLFCISGS